VDAYKEKYGVFVEDQDTETLNYQHKHVGSFIINGSRNISLSNYEVFLTIGIELKKRENSNAK